MHTLKVLAVGFVLLAIFVLTGRALGQGSRAALYFLPVWLTDRSPESMVWSSQSRLLRSRRVPYLPADLRCSLGGRSSPLVETPLAISPVLSYIGPRNQFRGTAEPYANNPHFRASAHGNTAPFRTSRFTRLTPLSPPAGRRSTNLL